MKLRRLSRSALPLVLATLVGFSNFAFTQITHAQISDGAQDITMTPASTDLTIAPGETVEASFEVINGGNEGFGVNLSVAPYSVENISYDPNFTQLPGTTSVTDWINITEASAELAAHTSKKINYSVSAPTSAAPGGYYAVLFAETNPLTDDASGIVPHNRVGNVLYITVSGPVSLSGSAETGSLPRFLFQSTLPMNLTVTNNGGVHFVTTVEFSVKSLTGNELYHNTAERYVLPQTQRLIETTWTPSAPLGFYTMSRTATIGDELQTLPDQWVIIIQPWLLGVLFLLLAAIGVFLSSRVFIRHHSHRKKQKEE